FRLAAGSTALGIACAASEPGGPPNRSWTPAGGRFFRTYPAFKTEVDHMALEQNTHEAQDRAQGVGDTNRRPDDATEHGGTRTERLAEQARARAAELRECGLEEFSEAREEIRKDARQIAREGREGARRIAEQQKSRLAAHMHRIGDSLRQASGSLEPEEFTPVRRYSQM